MFLRYTFLNSKPESNQRVPAALNNKDITTTLDEKSSDSYSATFLHQCDHRRIQKPIKQLRWSVLLVCILV